MRRGIFSNYHGARKCGFGAKPGPKRTSCSGRAQQGIGARRDYRPRDEFVRLFSIPRRTPAGALDAHLWWAVRLHTYLQRDCYAQLYCIPRQTRAGILDVQLGSKACLGVKNFTLFDLGRRAKIHRRVQCHHHAQQNGKNDGAIQMPAMVIRTTETQGIQPDRNYLRIKADRAYSIGPESPWGVTYREISRMPGSTYGAGSAESAGFTGVRGCPRDVRGNPRESAGVRGCLRVVRACPRLSAGVRGSPRESAGICGCPRMSADVHGCPLVSVGVCGCPRRARGCPLLSAGVRSCPLVSAESPRLSGLPRRVW